MHFCARKQDNRLNFLFSFVCRYANNLVFGMRSHLHYRDVPYILVISWSVFHWEFPYQLSRATFGAVGSDAGKEY